MNAGLNKKPEGLSDPVAQKTQWDPLFNSAADFQTQNFTHVPGTGLISRKQKPVSLLVLMVFLGFIFPRDIGESILNGQFTADPATLKALIPFAAFAVAAIGISLFNMRQKIVFDQNMNIYHAKGTDYPFRDLHAVQIVRVGSGNSGRLNCQLTLVLNDARRLPVGIYSKPNDARLQAAKIQDFVGLPLWDISEPEDQTDTLNNLKGTTSW